MAQCASLPGGGAAPWGVGRVSPAMPRSSKGKWVARAGSTGGGRTYRGQMPVNWYAALVLIIIVGLGSVVFARYEYQRGVVTNTVPPTKGGAPWFAALAFDICGTQRPPLPSNAIDTAKQSFYTTGNGVITISPKSTGAAGHNAVLGKFVSSYKGLTLTASEIRIPPPTPALAPKKGKKSAGKGAKTYRNGQRCPAGTKDAGKKGVVSVKYWPSAFSSKEKPVTASGNPGTVRFTDDQLITVGFVPAGTNLPKPSGSIVTALLNATAGSSSAPSSTPTTAPSSTSTTAPSSTSTTAPSSTSTTAPTS